MQVIKLSDKYYITIHHLKLYKPSKIKQQKLNFLLKNWNKAIRSALKIVKHWGFTNFNKSHKHTYYVLRNNFNLSSQVAVEAKCCNYSRRSHKHQKKYHKRSSLKNL